MTRLVLVPMSLTLAAIAGCLESHDAQKVIAQDDCYTCHKGDYDATSMPVHQVAAPDECSTDCVQCHVTATWANSLIRCNHPDDNARFPLKASLSQHRNVRCIECHSPAIANATGATAVGGADTDCTRCHPTSSGMNADHETIVYKTGPLLGRPYTYSTSDHRFCLECHRGGYIVSHGPANPFDLPHHGARCVKCHDYASGLGHTGAPGSTAARADVRCVTSGCHGGEHEREELADHGRIGCLDRDCHPDGRKHDD